MDGHVAGAWALDLAFVAGGDLFRDVDVRARNGYKEKGCCPFINWPIPMAKPSRSASWHFLHYPFWKYGQGNSR